MDNNYRIKSESDLRAVIGEPMDFVRVKLVTRLDGIMQEFIARSPLIFVSTIDDSGRVDVSPKGDPPGFVRVDDEGNLLIPERPGNKLIFGFHNILRNGQIGIILLAPNQRETLRIKGTATLHRDPAILEQMSVNGSPALMYTRVEVKECFFHCGKALIRSRLWQPEFWDQDTASIGARQFASLGGRTDEAGVIETERRLDESYKNELY